MNKITRKINNMVFDAAGPIFFLLAYGVPVFIVIAVIALIIVAVILILRARRKNTKKTEPPETDEASTEE